MDNQGWKPCDVQHGKGINMLCTWWFVAWSERKTLRVFHVIFKGLLLSGRHLGEAGGVKVLAVFALAKQAFGSKKDAQTLFVATPSWGPHDCTSLGQPCALPSQETFGLAKGDLLSSEYIRARGCGGRVIGWGRRGVVLG